MSARPAAGVREAPQGLKVPQVAPISAKATTRRTPDSAWPLTRADGSKFYEPRRNQ